MTMRTVRDADVTLDPITTARVAMIGYGNQAEAHALNLRDSGVADLVVGVRDRSPSEARARAAGFPTAPIGQAIDGADVVMLLTPDETHAGLWRDVLETGMKPGAALGFAHGLAVHFGLIAPRPDLDVFLVAPKGPGRALRREYAAGRGLPCLFAVAQDASGNARATALAYAAGLGCGRSGMIETSFAEECVTDLFGEQAVLCGGLPDLLQAGYDTLVEAGYDPVMAYFECVHEAKLIVDLIYERGLADMRRAISTTAEFGGYVTGARIVTDDTRAAMRAVLADIRSGAFAHRLQAEHDAGDPLVRARRDDPGQAEIEEAGRQVRAFLPWLSQR